LIFFFPLPSLYVHASHLVLVLLLLVAVILLLVAVFLLLVPLLPL
jgi:hypothetical protein